MFLFLQRTPLGWAVVHGNVEIAALLLQFGASLSTEFKWDEVRYNARTFAEKQGQKIVQKQGISFVCLPEVKKRNTERNRGG